MSRSLILCLALAWAGVAHGAPTDLLFEKSVLIDRSSNIFSSNEFDLELVLTDSFFQPTSTVKLFDSISVTPASVGQTFEATSLGDPNFDAAVTQLTDGIDQVARVILTEKSTSRAEGRGGKESGFFLGLNPGPDFAGRRIEAIRMRIDNFQLGSTPTASPGVQLNVTLSVLGSVVPEPGSALLAVIGLASVAGIAYTGRRAAGAASRR